MERLAVLPLANLSSEPDGEYFSAGLTEELIAALAKLMRGRLGVIARTSVLRFSQECTRTAPEIAVELGARYLLEGSVRREGERLRVALRLLDGRDGTALWSETFASGSADTFALQREIALAVAAATRTSLPAGEDTPAPRPGDPRVHDLYLRARFLWAQRTRPSIETAMRLFREALALDHTYAPAYAGLSCCYAILPITTPARPGDCFPHARSIAEEAIRHDPAQSEAWIALGLEAFWYRRDWEAAIRHFRQAERLHPADSAAPMFLAHVHSVLREPEQALATIAAAHRLDPLSPIVATHVGHFLYNAGRPAEALLPLDRVLELVPHFWIAHLMRGKALAALGRADEALDAFARSEDFSQGHTEPLSFRIFTLAETGRTAEARQLMEQLLASSPAAPVHRALAALGLGDLRAAEAYLDTAFAERDVRLVFVAVEPRWRQLGTPAYGQLLARAGFAQDIPNPKP